MKNKALFSMLIALVLFAGVFTSGVSAASTTPLSPVAQGRQDFRLTNATGVLIYNVYVSPHSSNEWGDDILGQDTLPNGESVDITFSPRERAAMWDLKVTDPQGNSIQWMNLNLLRISHITLRYENGRAWADIE